MRNSACKEAVPTLEEFVFENDRLLYENSAGGRRLFDLMALADVTVTNTFTTLIELGKRLVALNILNPERLRPSWDTYFMRICDLAAKRSNCMKRKVGCVLVKDHRVVATGYNGTPRGLINCNDGGCARCNSASPCGHGLDTCLCLHAEENALIEAGRARLDERCVLYCNT
jgi:dCMP deaminase